MAKNSNKAQGLKSVSIGLTSARNCRPCEGKKLTSKAILMGEQYLLSDFPVPQIVDTKFNKQISGQFVFVFCCCFVCLFVCLFFVCLLLLLLGRGEGGAGEVVKEKKKKKSGFQR